MNALSSALSMLRGFAFSNVLSGLRGLGGSASAFAGFGAMPANEQERVLHKSLRYIMGDAGVRFTANSYGAVGADLLQDVAAKILAMARADAKFMKNPEAWIEKRLNTAFVKRMIHNAWVSHRRSPHTRKEVSGEARPVDGEGVEGETELERAADEDATPERTERRISVNRELPALLKLYVKRFGPAQQRQIEDLAHFGGEAMAEAEDLIAKSIPPVEARRRAYKDAARRWSLKHKEAAPGYLILDADGQPQDYDYTRFQRDLVTLMSKLRAMATQRGAYILSREQGVFLSENRQRSEQAGGGSVFLPGTNVPIDPATGKRLYVSPHEALYDNNKASPFDAWERMARKSPEHKAAKKARNAELKVAAKEAKDAAKAAAKQAKLEARSQQIATKRAVKAATSAAALDDAEAKLAKKRKVLEAAAETLSPQALAAARAVISDMAEKLAKKRAALKAKLLQTTSSDAPIVPSFADRLMAIKSIDAEEADEVMDDAAQAAKRAEAVARKEAFDAEQMAKRTAADAARRADDRAKAGLKGVSAFNGLFGW